MTLTGIQTGIQKIHGGAFTEAMKGLEHIPEEQLSDLLMPIIDSLTKEKSLPLGRESDKGKVLMTAIMRLPEGKRSAVLQSVYGK